MEGKVYEFTIPTEGDPAALAVLGAAGVLATSAQSQEAFDATEGAGALVSRLREVFEGGNGTPASLLAEVAEALADFAETNNAGEPDKMRLRVLMAPDEDDAIAEASALHPGGTKEATAAQIAHVSEALYDRALVACRDLVVGEKGVDGSVVTPKDVRKSMTRRERQFYMMAWNRLNGVPEAMRAPFVTSQMLVST